MTWIAEDKFEYSVGALDGNGSAGSGWDGAWTNVNGSIDVVSSPVVVGSGAAHVLSTENSKRAVTDVTSGTFYISIRGKYNSSSAILGILPYGNNGLTQFSSLYLDLDDSSRNILFYDGASKETGFTYEDDTYIRLGLEFDCSTDQIRFNADNGTWTSWYDFSSSVSSFDSIRFWGSVVADDGYWDYISPNYSDVTPYEDDWSSSKEMTIDNTKVSGSSDLTDFPVLIKDGNLPDDVYSGVDVNTKSIYLDKESSQYLSITDANQTGLDFNTGDLSAMFWVKRDINDDYGAYFYKDDSSQSNGRGYLLRPVASGKLEFRYYSSNTVYTACTTNDVVLSSLGTWDHIALAVDVSTHTINIYVNGSLKAVTYSGTSATSIQNSVTDFRIGVISQHSDFYIDEIGMYNTVLTATDISNDYNSGNGTIRSSSETGIVAGWRFENDLLDVTSNNNDLTNNNSATFSTDVPFGDKPQDLRFSTDSDGATKLNFEVVSFDAENKESEIWVKIPTVDYNDDTTIYAWYGNSSASYPDADDADEGSEGVWNEYNAMWHLNEVSGDRSDSSSGGKTMVDNNTVGSTTSTKIGNYAADFVSANSEYLSSTFVPPSGSSTRHFSFWVNPDDVTTNQRVWFYGTNSLLQRFSGVISTIDSVNTFWIDVNGYWLRMSTALSIGTWYHIVVDIPSGSTVGDIKLYLNGVEETTVSNDKTKTINTGATYDLDLGLMSWNSTQYLDAQVQKFAVKNGTLTPDWIATEYNNQNEPSTFWKSASPAANTTNFFQLLT